jgi:hypothetical protein
VFLSELAIILSGQGIFATYLAGSLIGRNTGNYYLNYHVAYLMVLVIIPQPERESFGITANRVLSLTQVGN